MTGLPNSLHRTLLRLAALVAVAAVAGPCAVAQAAPQGIHKIEHVVMIMQENRSYDTYFGTYPGGNGIPRGTCVPDPAQRWLRQTVLQRRSPQCRRSARGNAAIADIDGGKMDGFVAQAENAGCAKRAGAASARAKKRRADST